MIFRVLITTEYASGWGERGSPASADVVGVNTVVGAAEDVGPAVEVAVVWVLDKLVSLPERVPTKTAAATAKAATAAATPMITGRDNRDGRTR